MSSSVTGYILHVNPTFADGKYYLVNAGPKTSLHEIVSLALSVSDLSEEHQARALRDDTLVMFEVPKNHMGPYAVYEIDTPLEKTHFKERDHIRLVARAITK